MTTPKQKVLPPQGLWKVPRDVTAINTLNPQQRQYFDRFADQQASLAQQACIAGNIIVVSDWTLHNDPVARREHGLPETQTDWAALGRDGQRDAAAVGISDIDAQLGIDMIKAELAGVFEKYPQFAADTQFVLWAEGSVPVRQVGLPADAVNYGVLHATTPHVSLGGADDMWVTPRDGRVGGLDYLRLLIDRKKVGGVVAGVEYLRSDDPAEKLDPTAEDAPLTTPPPEHWGEWAGRRITPQEFRDHPLKRDPAPWWTGAFLGKREAMREGTGVVGEDLRAVLNHLKEGYSIYVCGPPNLDRTGRREADPAAFWYFRNEAGITQTTQPDFRRIARKYVFHDVQQAARRLGSTTLTEVVQRPGDVVVRIVGEVGRHLKHRVDEAVQLAAAAHAAAQEERSSPRRQGRRLPAFATRQRVGGIATVRSFPLRKQVGAERPAPAKSAGAREADDASPQGTIRARRRKGTI